MTTSEYDSLRPPDPAGGRRKRNGGRRRRPGAGSADGSREMPMVPEAEFTSYYGRPVVKPAPWGHEIAAYLFLGGVAGGSALLAAGAQLTGQDTLRRNCRLSAISAVRLGAGALVHDLGRPERFLNMLRTIKLTSPMSLGSWILSAFSAGAGVAAAAEIDRMTGERLPLGPLRGVLRAVEGPAGLEAAAFAPLLAVYTAVLLGDTPRRPGTPPTRNCPSFSSARPAWPHRDWRWSPPRSPRQRRPAGWPWRASSATSSRRR